MSAEEERLEEFFLHFTFEDKWQVEDRGRKRKEQGKKEKNKKTRKRRKKIDKVSFVVPS